MVRKKWAELRDSGGRKPAATSLSQGEKDVMYIMFGELQFFVFVLAKQSFFYPV